MNKIVGVKFKPYNKLEEFKCEMFVLSKGNHVIVKGEEGFLFGTVMTDAKECVDDKKLSKLKPVYRLATPEDISQQTKNIEKENEAFDFCKNCIKELNLIMNLFKVECAFDGSKLTFFFTAEGRVDFRQLVKLLVKQFRVRIEMRQVGVRNQAKMCNGLGRCGRQLCCSTFLDKFDPVSIRMAKEQNLSLNPTKISGLCGRLMCCLTYENETYIYLKKQFPKIGKIVKVEAGQGKVVRHNVISNRLTVRLDSGAEIEMSLDDINKNKE